MNVFLNAYLKLASLRKQYRRGTWWQVSFSQAEHRSKMRRAQLELGASARALGFNS